ncbi:hypothetical protein ACH5AO_23545 [Streptomyces sp. NPDC018964]|uniref:hypothetical protein n=1 Tax=unclassified Streptomyces TaxID=2593676 RepID=UPI0037AD6302
MILRSAACRPERAPRSTAAPLTVSDAGERMHLVHADGAPGRWLTDLAGRLGPVRPGEAVLLVGTPLHGTDHGDLCDLLAPVLEADRDAHVRLLLLVMSTGAEDRGIRPSAARLIAERWGFDVLAASGAALVAPDGSLFSPDLPGEPGGWWHFAPGAVPRPVSSRLPVSGWEAGLKGMAGQEVAGHVVEPVPAGLVVRPSGPVSDVARTLPHTVPPDRAGPQLIVASPAVPAAVPAVVMAALPESVREATRLLSLDVRSVVRTGHQVARLLRAPVRVGLGLPVMVNGALRDGASAGDATTELRTIDAGGVPSWRPFAQTVVCGPASGPDAARVRVTEWRVPAASLSGGTEPDALPLDRDWAAAVTPAGLWIGPRGEIPPSAASTRAVSADTVALDLGVDRGPHDSLWRALDVLFDQLETEVRERAVVHVHGPLGAEGRKHLRHVTARHGVRLAPSARRDRGGAQVSSPSPGPDAGAGPGPGDGEENAAYARLRAWLETV